MVPKKIIVIVWLCLVSATVCAQFFVAPERMALNNIEKKKWERAEAQLRKAMRKDMSNATVKYVFALYFSDADNPAFQIDSAYHYTLRSLADFQRADERALEHMRRFPLDTLTLLGLRQRIDSVAFEQTARINTEDAYLKFLSTYTFAKQRPRAVELRDEVAYFSALKDNTYQAFAAFLTKYPTASRAEEAKRKYERLLYDTKTKDKKLSSYENFLREFPMTPYRRDAEHEIFEKMTALGASSGFEAFLKRYPKSVFANKARNFLYHIMLEHSDEDDASSFWNDSLRTVHESEKKFLIPYYKDGKYGFLNEEGKEVINPTTEVIDPSYLCGNVLNDVLIFSDKAVAKNGTIIYSGDILSADDLGFGFMLIESGNCLKVIHKSEGIIIDCAEDARVLNGKMIAVKNKNRWSLHTITGRKLPDADWDNINFIGDVFVFQSGNKFSLARIADLESEDDSKRLKPTNQYDEVKSWPGNRVWVKTGDLQGVLDQSLKVYIKPDRHILSSGSSTSLAQSSSGFTFFNESGQQSVNFKKVLQNELWTAVKNESWRLFDPVNNKYQSTSYDSISFTGPFAIGMEDDSLKVFFSLKRTADFPSTTTIEFIPGKDSTSFLVVGDDEKRTIYNRYGQRLFSAVFDKIQYAGNGLFIIQKKDKNKKDRKGLVNENGKVLLAPEFDAIGSVTNGCVSLLKDKKFGLMNVKSLLQIKPEYSKNVTLYAKKYLTAYDGHLYGFITWDNKPVGDFGFDEIRYWNDSVSWVRKNYQWMLYNIRTQEIIEDQIKDYSFVVDSENEKIVIFHQDGYYGVISNKKDEIIPPTFSSIINVGSTDQPMYFTAKHVEEASIYVVIYYDQHGKLLRRQVYEEADYEKISCAKK